VNEELNGCMQSDDSFRIDLIPV